MPAIITDQIRVLNASNFVSGISTDTNSYYVFIGLPNATDVKADWNTNTPTPVDNFNNSSDWFETLIAAKKITSTDVLRVIPKIEWTNGAIYDMYRHDYSVDNTDRPVNLYKAARYYVMNSDYRVYECIYNGAAPSNLVKGIVSLEEPTHTDLQPKLESDGYIWKYLYTIKPAEIVKFDSVEYIPVPTNWMENSSVSSVRNAAVNGKIEVITIDDVSSAAYQYAGVLNNVPIEGDGFDGMASVEFTDGKPTNVQVTDGGRDYTFGTLNLSNLVSGSGAEFSVIIPPPGGHGADIYRELGVYHVLVYTRLENSDVTNPDLPIGNQFSRIGIIKNPEINGTTNLLTDTLASGVYGLRLTGSSAGSLSVQTDGIVTQTIGIGSTAVGKVVSYDTTTNILKFWQDRSLATDSVTAGIPAYGYRLNRFTSTPDTGGSTNVVITTTTGTETLAIDTNYNGDSGLVNSKTYYFGQNFTKGLAEPEIKQHSGDIIYVDNRPEVTRAENQREDIKIVLEF